MNCLSFLPILLFSVVFSCASVKAQTIAPNVALNNKSLTNLTAYIPPQCYTKTADQDSKVSNPCYVCHTKSVEPNYVNDQELQLSYSFPETAHSGSEQIWLMDQDGQTNTR